MPPRLHVRVTHATLRVHALLQMMVADSESGSSRLRTSELRQTRTMQSVPVCLFDSALPVYASVFVSVSVIAAVFFCCYQRHR